MRWKYVKYQLTKKVGDIYKKLFGYKFIKFNSLREEHEWYDSWKFKFYASIGLFTGSFDSPIQTSLKLTSPAMFDWNEIKQEHGPNLKLICEECQDKFGKLCVFDPNYADKSIILTAGKFTGIEITHEDYYYMVEYSDGHTGYNSCVGKILFIDEDKSEAKYIETSTDKFEKIYEYEGIQYFNSFDTNTLYKMKC